jgi:hypothetical protein
MYNKQGIHHHFILSSLHVAHLTILSSHLPHALHIFNTGSLSMVVQQSGPTVGLGPGPSF